MFVLLIGRTKNVHLRGFGKIFQRKKLVFPRAKLPRRAKVSVSSVRLPWGRFPKSQVSLRQAAPSYHAHLVITNIGAFE